jgi:Flp pilus assembly protein TadD
MTRAVPLCLVAVTILVFAPLLGGGFLNWDDDRALVANESVRGVGPAQLRWMFTTTLLGHYAPLAWLSFGLTYAMAGLAPWAYRAGNVALHAANAVLVYQLARHLLRAARPDDPAISRVAGAAVAALVFALHPLRVESVGWISDRGDLLCATFYLLAVLAHLRGVDSATPWRWRAAAAIAFAAALLSKEIALTLPISLLLLDAYPLRRWRLGLRALVVEKAGLLALSAAGAAVALLARTEGGAWTSYGTHGVGARVALPAYSLAFYPLKLLWPAGLSPLHELPDRLSPLEGRFVAAAAGVVLVTVALAWWRHRMPGALTAWLHAAVAVAPVSGLVHAGTQLVASRYTYLPGIGFAVLAGGALAWVLESRRRGVLSPGVTAAAVVGTAGALVLLASLSWQQTWAWRDSVSLWRAALAVEVECRLCQAKLGAALLERGAAREAEPHLRRAVELWPGRAGLHVDLAVALALTGRDAEAERQLGEAIRLAPSSVMARANLAALYTRQQRLDEAVAVLHEATALRGDDARLLLRLGAAQHARGRHPDAVTALERAVRLAPELAEARFLLARTYLDTGDADRAAPHIAALQRLDPVSAARLSAPR